MRLVSNGPTVPDDAVLGLPTWLMVASIVVGIALVSLGASLLVLYIPLRIPSLLILCVGVGILLAAFGTTAEVKWRKWTITGGGAVAVILFWLVTTVKPVSNFVIGTIVEADDIEEIQITGPLPMLIGNGEGGRFKFIAFEGEITSKHVRIVGTAYPGRPVQEIDIACIPSSLFLQRVGGELTLSLQLAKSGDHYQLTDLSDNKSYGKWQGKFECGEDEIVTAGDGFLHNMWQLFGINMAVAQEAPKQLPWMPSEATAPVLQDVLEGLKSGVGFSRDQSRDALATLLASEEAQQIVRYWQPLSSNEYRTDLGWLVGIYGASEKFDAGTKIATSLSDSQIEHLVTLNGFPESIMRLWAQRASTELLLSAEPEDQLRIAEVITSAFQVGNDAQLPSTFDKEALWMSALGILEATECNLAAGGRAQVAGSLEVFKSYQGGGGPNASTLELATKVLGDLSACP